MTPRQRYLEAILFGEPDRVPLTPGGPRESTRAAWYKQGLPEGANYMSALHEILGIKPEEGGTTSARRGTETPRYNATPARAPERTKPAVSVGVSFRMMPEFQERVLKHEDGHYLVSDWMGAIVEISDTYDYTYLRSAKDFVTRKWHKFPVETRDDWERMKQRYDPETPGRFPDDFDERCEALQDRDYVTAIHFNGPFWQLREWCGMEGLCILMADEPEFVDEMCEFWTEFVSRTMAPILERVQLDRVGLSEDMAFKAHSMISPAMCRRFLMPAYERWVSEIKASGCPIIDMDSDGYIGELIPLWIEAGINCCCPIEAAAHNDIVEFRRQFGRKMAYHGAIDKRAIAAGGKVMEDEMMRVVPPLLEEGGFIPGCDHGVPPDISWPNFIEYTRLLAELTGWL